MPTFVSATAASNAVGDATISLTAPTGIVVGNLLLAIVGANSTDTGLSPPAGWSSLTGASSSNGCDLSVWARTAGPNEPPAYTFTGGSWLAGTILQYSGAGIDGDNVNVLDFETVAVTIPDGTASTASDIWVSVIYTEDGVTPSVPAGFTKRAESIAPSWDGISAYDQNLTVTGDTGTASSTTDSQDNGLAVTILIMAGGGPANPPPDGQILMAYGESNPANILEQYNPTAGSWAAVSTPWDSTQSVGTNYIDAGIFVAEIGTGTFFLGGVGWHVNGYPVLLSSEDAVTWTQVSTPMDGYTDSYITGFIWNGSMLLAVGWGPDNVSMPAMMTSTDGISWTMRSSVFDGGFVNDVAWNGSQYMIVGNNVDSSAGLAAVSSDGITWTSVSMPWTNPITVEWHPVGKFWMVGGQPTWGSSTVGQILTSPDGSSWTTVTVPLGFVVRMRYLPAPTTDLPDAVFATGLYGSAGAGYSLAVSVDGQTNWTAYLVGSNEGNAIFWDGTQYWQGANDATYKSPDGQNWVQSPGLLDVGQNFGFVTGVPTAAPPPQVTPTYVGTPGFIPIKDPGVSPPPNFSGSLFATGTAVPVGGSGNDSVCLARFENGIWSDVPTPWDSHSAQLWCGVFAGGSLQTYFVGGQTSDTAYTYPQVMASSDGNTWSTVPTPWDGSANSFVSSMAWNGQQLIVVGNGPSGSDPAILVTTDGSTWTACTSVFGPGLGCADIAWNGHYWLAVGWDGANNGAVAKSLDGLYWTTVSSSPWNTGSQYALSVTWHAPAGLWVLAGSVRGQVLTSPDPTQGWNVQSCNINIGRIVRSVANSGVLVGGDQTGQSAYQGEPIAASPDAVAWELEYIGSTNPVCWAVYWDGTTFWAGLGNTQTPIWASVDARTWIPQLNGGSFTNGSGFVNGYFSRGTPTPPMLPVSSITFVSGSAMVNPVQSSQIAIPAPSSIVPGNFLIAIIAGPTGNSTSGPGGWTWRGTNSHNSAAVYTKVANGAEPSDYVFGIAPAIGSISYQNSSGATNSSAVSSQAVAAPQNIVPGNLLIAFAVTIGNSGTWTPPSGFSQIGAINLTGYGSLTVFTKTATASEPSAYTFSETNSNVTTIWVMQYAQASVDGAVVFNSGQSTAMMAPTVTPSLNNEVWLTVHADFSGVDWADPASPPITRFHNTPYIPMAVYEHSTTSGTPTGPYGVNVASSVPWAACSILLAPAAPTPVGTIAGTVLQYSGVSDLDGYPYFGDIASGTTAATATLTPSVTGEVWVAAFYGAAAGADFPAPASMLYLVGEIYSGGSSIVAYGMPLESSGTTDPAYSTPDPYDSGTWITFLLHP